MKKNVIWNVQKTSFKIKSQKTIHSIFLNINVIGAGRIGPQGGQTGPQGGRSDPKDGQIGTQGVLIRIKGGRRGPQGGRNGPQDGQSPLEHLLAVAEQTLEGEQVGVFNA
jgi:hypothetical protein